MEKRLADSSIAGRAKINWREACGYYISLGYMRSYAAVARRYRVSDVAVRKHALAEGWEEIARPVDEKRQRELLAVLRTPGQAVFDAIHG